MANPTKAPANVAAPVAQHATGVAAEHGHAPAGSFPPFDKSTFVPQLVWLALTFGFLYVMLSRRLLDTFFTLPNP